MKEMPGKEIKAKELSHLSRASAPEGKLKRKTFDWLSGPHSDDLTSWQRWFLGLDWSKSPLGPIKSWPNQLRKMALLVNADPSPAVVYWGDDNIIVYNEAYTQLIGSKHPDLQGQDPKVGFAEIWDHFEALLAQQREDGVTVIEDNAPLLLHRHGFLEETYFSWKFVPLVGLEGWIVGSHATVVEVTREVISDRRLTMVRELSRELSQATTISDLWSGIIKGLESAPTDIPLAVLYTVADPSQAMKEVPPSMLPISPGTVCLLEGCIGIERGHWLSPHRVDFDNDDSCYARTFREAMNQPNPLEIPLDEKTQKMANALKWRGFGVPSTKVVVCPIIPYNSTSCLAFLVIALNPRRPYDDDYRGFLHLLTQQVTTPQLSAVIFREEVDRRQQLARTETMERERLSKELSESETKFARFATRAPIGLAILRPDGYSLSANDLWRDFTQLEVGSHRVSWNEVLVAGETELVNQAWDRMLTEKQPVILHTKIRRPWKAPELDVNGKEQWIDTHLLLAMYPDLDDDSEVVSVMSCVTDISGLKWSEAQLRRRMDQAIELKQQQERFIDMTSHEMRNPLSALIGCADEIVTCLKDYSTSFRTSGALSQDGILPSSNTSLPPIHLLDEAIEAADTIIYCAMHQKRIIDDILTLSRLDSNLLLVSPEPSEPIQLVRSAIKMFEAEVRRADVKLDLIEQESLSSLAIQWTLLDPSRVLQVLINLMTNAIKFTRTEPKREIKITVGASLCKPSEVNEFGVEYVPKTHLSPDQTTKSEWGSGPILYLSITVQDTGRGLSAPETRNLFHLFQQASPKTYTQYGGSGLGLFISRQLVEMQGGEIGVKSASGVGSTFTFYVKTRRTSPPSDGKADRTDWQLLVRDDALREACGVEIPALKDGGSMADRQPAVQPRITRAPSVDAGGVLHILVVEDNLVNQKVVSKQLRKEGHIVSVANHGEEALDFIRRTRFWRGGGEERLSVILLDLEMPVMDGITCVKVIRKMEESGEIRGHVPVIAVTANARKDQILRSLEAGMDDVTTKPYRIQDMLKQIEKLVAKYNIPGLP